MAKSRIPSKKKPRDCGRVRQCMRMDQRKLDLAKKHFGVATETAAVDRALDYVIFQKEYFGVATETEAVDNALDMIAFRNEVISELEAAAALGPLEDLRCRR